MSAAQPIGAAAIGAPAPPAARRGMAASFMPQSVFCAAFILRHGAEAVFAVRTTRGAQFARARQIPARFAGTHRFTAAIVI